MILVYHNITKRFSPLYRDVPLQVFKAQLNYLLKNKKEFILTFDDGFKNVIELAYPLLSSINIDIKPIVFIPTGFIGKTNTWDFNLLQPLYHLDKNDLLFLYKHGWIIGSHSVYHLDLTQLPLKEAEREICYSKKYLEDLLGTEVKYFAYPFGRFNSAIIDIVRKCGYQIAYATAMGQRGNPFALPRVALYWIDLLPFDTSILNIRNKIITLASWLTPFLYQKFFISLKRDIK